MALDLYLVVVTTNGPLFGSSAPANLRTPLRSGAAVNRPLVVSDFAFGVDAPVSSTGQPSKPDLSELTVTLPDDSVTPALLTSIGTGRALPSVDVLAVTTGDTPRVVSATGVTTALVTALSHTVTTDGVVVKLAFDGRKFLVGSSPQRADGTYGTFAFVTYDVQTGTVT